VIEFGFFKQLKDFVENRASERISDKMREDLNEATFCELMTEKIKKDMEKPIWITHFQTCGYLTNPQQIDIETVHGMYDGSIAEFLEILINAMKQFCEANLENSLECVTLHEYYKLLKAEAKTRPSLKDYIHPQDAYLDYIANKSVNQAQAQALQSARLTGSVCIFCGSKNVHSKGKEWKCFDCGKRFSKHY
jgi:hypothetical protein